LQISRVVIRWLEAGGVTMRGEDQICGQLFSYIDPETRVRADHPSRAIRGIANAALSTLSGEFAALYSGIGRPAIAPEKLLRAMLLQAFYSVRSERRLMERIEFDLLFRWFVGIGIDDPIWDHSSFSKNRDRLLEGEIAAKFLAAVLSQPRVKRLLSGEYFAVDGTLIEAWASLKSSSRKTIATAARGAAVAMRQLTSAVRSVRTRPIAAPPIPTPGSTARAGDGSEAVLHRPSADGEPLGSARRR
jgi:transposase